MNNQEYDNLYNGGLDIKEDLSSTVELTAEEAEAMERSDADDLNNELSDNDLAFN